MLSVNKFEEKHPTFSEVIGQVSIILHAFPNMFTVARHAVATSNHMAELFTKLLLLLANMQQQLLQLVYWARNGLYHAELKQVGTPSKALLITLQVKLMLSALSCYFFSLFLLFLSSCLHCRMPYWPLSLGS